MPKWSDFETDAPELCATGRRLMYQQDPHASAFLATVDATGMPRVHPVFPVIAEGSLWLFIVNMSPKYSDLKYRSKFALHTFPVAGEEFHLRGNVMEITSHVQKSIVSAATNNRQGILEFEALFECNLVSALHTCWKNWGHESAWPEYDKWIA